MAIGAASILAVMVLLVPSVNVVAAPVDDPVVDFTQAGDTPETTTVTLLLAHPLTLEDALSVSAKAGEPVVAYAFDNGSVVGEYAPGSGVSVEEYLKYFEYNYGTQPQVNGLVVVRSAEAQEEARSSPVEQTSLGSDHATFTGSEVRVGGDAAVRAEYGARAAEQAAANGDGARVAGDWRADDVQTRALQSGSSRLVWSDTYWFNYGLYSLPNDIGLEFEVNQHNDTVADPLNVRPFCSDTSYKDRFWAKNYSWTWDAYDSIGTPVGSLGAYADYNDLSDLCRTNSLAIGLKYPKNLDQFDGYTGLQVTIFPPGGTQSYSPISGNIQAVAAHFCNSFPGNTMSNTDCMGVQDITSVWSGYPTGNYNRATLAEWRNYTAPLACWTSGNRGIDAPVVISCT